MDKQRMLNLGISPKRFLNKYENIRCIVPYFIEIYVRCSISVLVFGCWLMNHIYFNWRKFCLIVSRVGSLLCLMNRIHICRVLWVTNETRGHWNGLCSRSPRLRTPSTPRGCIRSLGPKTNLGNMRRYYCHNTSVDYLRNTALKFNDIFTLIRHSRI